MADAAEKMQKKSERASEQYDLSHPGGECAVHDGIGLRAGSRSENPEYESDGGSGQEKAGKPVEDRKDRGQLWPVELNVGRERPLPR
jgi:hypothetical protein